MPLSFTTRLRGDLHDSLVAVGKLHGLGRPIEWRTRRRGDKVRVDVIFPVEIDTDVIVFEGKDVPCRWTKQKHATKPKRVRDNARRKEHTKDEVEGDTSSGDPAYAECLTQRDFFNRRPVYYDDDYYWSDDDSEDDSNVWVRG